MVMKKNSKKLLIFGMTSLMLMTGCKKAKVIEKNGEIEYNNIGKPVKKLILE